MDSISADVAIRRRNGAACMNRFALVAILAASLALTACYPSYHKETRVPEIRGTLIRDGAPVSGVEVLLAQNVVNTRPCEILEPATRTDEQGAFTIPMQVRTRYFRGLLNPPEMVGRLTAVCFRAPGDSPIFGGHFITRSHIPVTLQIACDESRPIRSTLVKADSICHDLNAHPQAERL
jgi:hypothetical protein